MVGPHAWAGVSAQVGSRERGGEVEKESAQELMTETERDRQRQRKVVCENYARDSAGAQQKRQRQVRRVEERQN